MRLILMKIIDLAMEVACMMSLHMLRNVMNMFEKLNQDTIHHIMSMENKKVSIYPLRFAQHHEWKSFGILKQTCEKNST